MNGDDALLKKRLKELSDRSRSRGSYEATGFLDLASQSVLHALENSGEVSPAALYGGTENAERVIAVFGNEETNGYEYFPGICCIRISPRSEKYGEELSHRDVLGALMSLGIKRELIGDLFTDGKTAYAVALASIAEYIEKNLTSVRHTDVDCERIDALPQGVGPHIREQCYISASERLDCIIAAVYNISRSAAKELFEKERVYVRGRLRANAGTDAKVNDVVSVRGLGKFVFYGPVGETKKGRLKISVGLYE